MRGPVNFRQELSSTEIGIGTVPEAVLTAGIREGGADLGFKSFLGSEARVLTTNPEIPPDYESGRKTVRWPKRIQQILTPSAEQDGPPSLGFAFLCTIGPGRAP